MKKIKNFMLVFFTIVLMIILVWIIYDSSSQNLSANDVFENNINSVVELKACLDDETVYGTAEFINSDGLLATNAHIVTYTSNFETLTYDSYYIRMISETDYRSVNLVSYDVDEDIATMQVDDIDFNFTAVTIGDSDNISSGDTVYAMGNGMNYGVSISQGIVSLPTVNITEDDITRTVIQCDLTIVSGNSGGALFNSKGELIGITSFRVKDSSGNIVYGWAYSLPINTVMNFIDN